MGFAVSDTWLNLSYELHSRLCKFSGLHIWLSTPEAINPPVCRGNTQTASASIRFPSPIPPSNPVVQQFPPVPRWGADFKVFKNRLPKPRNGMSPSRLGWHENSLPLLQYMKQVFCQNIGRFRRYNTTMGSCPKPNWHEIHMARRCTALANGNGIRFGVELIVTAGWLDTPFHDRILPCHDHGGFIQLGSNTDICNISKFHQVGLSGSEGKLQTCLIKYVIP